MREGNRPLAAAGWMLGAILGFSSMAVAGRELGGRLDTFDIMIWRSGVGLVLVLAWAAARGQLGQITTRQLPLHLGRNTVHFVGQNLWLAALTLIPLAQVFAIEFLNPILVALAAPLVLGERARGITYLSAVLGFCGILIVARPFGAGGGLSLGLIVAFGAALGFAATSLATKQLTRFVPTMSVLFWLCSLQLAMAVVCSLATGGTELPVGREWGLLVVVGVAGLVAHACLTTALSLAPASIVTPMDFLRLPLIAVVGMVLYGEPLDPFVFLGGAVVFGANWLNLAADQRARRRLAAGAG